MNEIITTTIVSALSGISSKLIADAYQALKAAIAKKVGMDSDTFKALEGLEKNPKSEGRRIILAEEIQDSNLDKDNEIIQLAEVLAEKISSGPKTIIKTGDNSVVVTEVKGNVNIKQENKNG